MFSPKLVYIRGPLHGLRPAKAVLWCLLSTSPQVVGSNPTEGGIFINDFFLGFCRDLKSYLTILKHLLVYLIIIVDYIRLTLQTSSKNGTFSISSTFFVHRSNNYGSK